MKAFIALTMLVLLVVPLLLAVRRLRRLPRSRPADEE
jgi:hypothetical protein